MGGSSSGAILEGISGVSRPLVAEGLGEGVAQLLVVGLERADALVRELEALPERAVAGGLSGGDGRCRGRSRLFLADLVEQVGLGSPQRSSPVA